MAKQEKKNLCFDNQFCNVKDKMIFFFKKYQNYFDCVLSITTSKNSKKKYCDQNK